MSPTRRQYLALVGGTAAAAAVPAAATAAEWTHAETPTAENLFGVAHTAEGPYAVGGGGTVITKAAEGWTLVLDGGPTGNGNNLYGAAVTDDGERLWFVGASGAIGEYDVTTDTLYDHSAPSDVTNNFNDVAVAGPAGDANVYVAGDSGKVYNSFENGATGTWNEVTPGSGAAIRAIDVHGPRAGHLIDGNQKVFVTDDGGTWNRIGVEDADYGFYGVTSAAADTVRVVGSGGTVLDYVDADWVRTDAGDAQLQAIADTTLAVGEGGVVVREDDGVWATESTPTGANLRDAVLGPDIAVGDSGVLLEY